MKPRVFVVDDKLAMAETLADGLADHGFEAVAFASAAAALGEVALREPAAIVTDLRMPEIDGFSLLDRLRPDHPGVQVIVMTAYGAIDSAVEAIRRGAYHYLTKPFKLDELVLFLRRAIADRALREEAATLRRRLGEQFSLAGIVARSEGMRRVLEVVQRIAPADVSVLVTGETGTGKGLVARALHGESGRAGAAFVAINCAALPEALLESELFGHVRGAFSGATADHEGLFAAADGGTLLLDEIGELPLALQAKLLRVIEAGVVRPVGATRESPVDVRIVAATHRDLRAAAARGDFREDLLYRLDVVSIVVPPLRERREDIPPLVERFLADAQSRHGGSRPVALSRGATQRVWAHAWPGNVRELAHAIERGVLLATGAEIEEADLGLVAAAATAAPAAAGFDGEIVPMIEMQRRYARWALDQLGGHKARTAERLDVDAKTLNRWLARPGGKP